MKNKEKPGFRWGGGLLVHNTFSHLFMLLFYLVFEVLVSKVYSEYHINFVAGSWSWVYNLQ
jgi:hypothetical protein